MLSYRAPDLLKELLVKAVGPSIAKELIFSARCLLPRLSLLRLCHV
jgi:hypothetical protein